ncbi:hypothetical protein EJ02DRAFT_455080 [Clathrospora elynae]|uniref:SWR1-complex protein 3 domain-containing protein n=1 Tax=Clathrospora elynae TaxID=706981 RepID=A0A6A5SP38_9PLEO|nr:hypothetical protein EJ02DRAFT_455080 [Clathrospora elynae]
MSEPRRSTRARAREDAAPPAPETPTETPTETAARGTKASLKRKRSSVAVKDSAPSTPVTDGAPLPRKHMLPFKLADGAPLPALPEPQPLDLPPSEWQNIQQSGVLEASLERSKAVWLSGVNFRTFHAHFTQPKKVADRTDEDKAKLQRQRELVKNFPQVGGDTVLAKLVIEPHTFPIRLYGPREVTKTVPKKVSTSAYGSWPNHHQPNQYTQYTNNPPAYQKPPPRPPPPKPVQAAPPPAAPSTPAPDPVIHMLAARAGTDPELKAVMKIVAAGHASKEQLEFFQTHINELTAILARQKEEKTPKALPPPPAPKAVAPPPLPRPVQPVQQQPLFQNAPKPYSPAPPLGQMRHTPPVHQPHPPYTSNYSKPPQYHQPPQLTTYTAPPPRTTYRPLVFSFVHGNEDRFYFPSYSFLEWLPNGKGAKISFLITKMKPKPDPTVKPLSTPAPQPVQTPIPGAPPNAPQSVPMTPTPNSNNSALATIHPAAPTPPSPYVAPLPPQRIEDFDESNEIANIDFYQPVTVLILHDDTDVGGDVALALPRSIRPPDVVEKYMNEVFDKCKRADETYLAFRLPRDGEDVPPEKRARSGDVTPLVGTPTQDFNMSGFGVGVSAITEKKKAGRPRKSPF